MVTVSAERKNRIVEIASCGPAPTVPFSRTPGTRESSVRAAKAAHRPDDRPDCDVALDAPEATAEISTNIARAAASPFAFPRSPMRRLHSFDSQTGRRLVKPYWVDDVGYHARSD